MTLQEIAPRTWCLENRNTRLTVGFDSANRYAILEWKNRGSGFDWASDPIALMDGAVLLEGRPVALRSESDTAAALGFEGATMESRPESGVLRVAFLGDGFRIVHTLRLYKDTATIDSQLWIENRSTTPVEVTHLDSLSLDFPFPVDGERPAVFLVEGVNPQIPYDERVPHPSFGLTRTRLEAGGSVEAWSGGRSSERKLDFFAFERSGSEKPEGGSAAINEGLFGGFEWSGERKLVVSDRDGSVRISNGLEGFRHIIAPGEVLISPVAVLGVYRGDVNTAGIELTRFAKLHLAPPLPSDFPWIMHNTWFSLGVNLTEKSLQEEIDVCADLGIEGIYLDAGWYDLSPTKTQAFDFSEGLGLWRENRTKFPNGVRALSDYAHSKGLKFGIWVEPERIAERTRGLQEDDWSDFMIAMNEGKKIENVHQTYLACLGCPETREWMIRRIGHVIEEYNLDWVKWDNNHWGNCDRADHGHQSGDGNYSHITGLYAVLDELRSRYPNVIFENCASGGNRMDLGLLQRTHVFWVHDDSFTDSVVRFHTYGTTFNYPSHYVNSWVIEGGDLSQIAKPVSETEFKRIFRSRMLGAMGVSMNLREWPDEWKTMARQQLAFFKENRRFLRGDVYHLTPQTVIYNKTWEPPDTWDVFQYHLPDTDESIVYCFRDRGAEATKRIRLRGVSPDRTYRVRFEDGGGESRLSGKSLLTDGVEIALDPRSSEVVFVQPE